MKRVFLRRLLRLVPVLLIVTIATTFMVSLVPGSPAVTVAGEGAPPQIIAQVNREYGFTEPPLQRYLQWVSHLAQGNFGVSYLTHQSVLDAIRQRLPVTLELAILAFVVAVIAAVLIALYTASHAGGFVDRGLGAISSALISVPVFVMASVLLYLFAIKLHVFPVVGWTPLTQNPLDNLRGAILPVLTLAATESVVLYRVLRADLIRTLQADFILVARAKGLPRKWILARHALRPSSFSVITLAGLSFGRLIGGTIIVEQMFSLPGIGSLLINSILEQDFIMMQGLVTFIAIAYLIINVLIDLLYAVVDPRVRVAT
jgi:peptide/nickel transport system permease protein